MEPRLSLWSSVAAGAVTGVGGLVALSGHWVGVAMAVGAPCVLLLVADLRRW